MIAASRSAEGARATRGAETILGGGELGAPLHAQGGVRTSTAMLSRSRVVAWLARLPTMPTDTIHPMSEWQEECIEQA